MSDMDNKRQRGLETWIDGKVDGWSRGARRPGRGVIDDPVGEDCGHEQIDVTDLAIRQSRLVRCAVCWETAWVPNEKVVGAKDPRVVYRAALRDLQMVREQNWRGNRSDVPELRAAGPVDGIKRYGAVDYNLICYKCRSPMVFRSGEYGVFYGCSIFPQCRETIKADQGTGAPIPKGRQPLIRFVGPTAASVGPDQGSGDGKAKREVKVEGEDVKRVVKFGSDE